MKTSETALTKLQSLSLITRVASELGNHLGLSDRTLAEFVISKAEKKLKKSLKRQAAVDLDARTIDTIAVQFQADLKENGADLPLSFVSNLLGMIFEMSPRLNKVKEQQAEKKAELEENR